MLILVDVLSGEAFELKDYKPDNDDGDPHGLVMIEYNGKRIPIEELLREWIENFLKLRWIPDASMDIIQVEWRNTVSGFLKNLRLIKPFPCHFWLKLHRNDQVLYFQRSNTNQLVS